MEIPLNVSGICCMPACPSRAMIVMTVIGFCLLVSCRNSSYGFRSFAIFCRELLIGFYRYCDSNPYVQLGTVKSYAAGEREK